MQLYQVFFFFFFFLQAPFSVDAWILFILGGSAEQETFVPYYVIKFLSVGRIYDRNLLWNCEEHRSLRMLLHWIPVFLWKFSTTGNLYPLKSWLWLAAVAFVVRWPISNALLNDIWLTRFKWMCNWNYWHNPWTVIKLGCRLAQKVKASAKTTSCKPMPRRYEFDYSQGQFVYWTCLLTV